MKDYRVPANLRAEAARGGGADWSALFSAPATGLGAASSSLALIGSSV
uniref:Uncharacterized protein n=1 Tax=Arundo donax TaxID=35708 RepID=A0A0A9HFZ4_ARUDO